MLRFFLAALYNLGYDVCIDTLSREPMEKHEKKSTTITITTGTIIKAVLVLVLVYALYFLRDLVLVILTSVVLASALEPAAAWFMKYKFPRVLAVLAVYVIVIGVLVGVFYAFVPALIEETAQFISVAPKYVESFKLWNPLNAGNAAITGRISDALSLQEIIANIRDTVSGTSGGFFHAVSSIFGGALSFILIIVLSFYFAVQETGIDDFLKIIAPLKHQKYVLSLWKRSQVKIGLWMQGQLLLAVIIAVLVFLGLTILGVPYALLLAFVAAIFELIPIFGPILAAIPAVILAFLMEEGGVSSAVTVALLYVIIQQFENHLIYPLVVRKVIGVPPILVIIALIIGIKLAGFLGVLLAVPAAAALMELAHDIEKEKEMAG